MPSLRLGKKYRGLYEYGRDRHLLQDGECWSVGWVKAEEGNNLTTRYAGDMEVGISRSKYFVDNKNVMGE